MKKLHRLITSLLVIGLVLSIVFTGCGKPAQEEKKTETPQTEAKTEETNQQDTADTQKKEPIKLKYTYWGSPQEKSAQLNAVQKFNESQNGAITVEAIHIPTDYDTKLTTMIAGNDAPDVAMLESATIAFPLAEQGKLLNLEESFSSDTSFNKDSLVPNICYYWDPGKLAGIGLAPETFVLYYNVEMFKEAGVEPPPAKVDEAWSWDQFVEAAKKLTVDQNGKNATQSGFDPNKIKQYGIDFPKWWGTWGNFVFGNGGDFLTADGTKSGLLEPGATEAIQKMADLINVHHVAPSPVQAKALPGSSVSLQTKKVAMVIEGQWISLDLGNAKFEYNVAALPKMQKSVTMIVSGMGSIFSSTKNPKESWEFFKYLINPEFSLDLHKGGLWMPAVKDWYTKPELIDKWASQNQSHPSGYKDAVIDMMLNHSLTTPTSYVKNFNKIMDIVNPALDKVWLGQKSASDALKEVEEKIQAEVKGRRPNN